jgi:hypothetical protein
LRRTAAATGNHCRDDGELGERVDGEQQGAGLGVVDGEDFDIDELLRCGAGAQVAVDEFQTAVGEFVGEDGAREADLLVECLEGGA